ncbi:MAG: response regulator transcription factor [Firmicutes bacterium]|nr:response regulator transcription factor [Bacillota bacterium]MBQ9603889.1 response regulator transcription factor [Bacillota bacterium]
MFKIILCDDRDEILFAVRDFTDTILENAEHSCRVFTNPLELLAADIADTDLFILDIGMPEMDGFELSQKLREKCAGAKIIFLTSETARVFDGYKYRAFRFVAKGDNEALKEGILSALPKVSEKRIDLNLKTEGHIKAALGDILYFEYNLRALTVWLKDGCHKLSGGRLADLTAQLEPLGFVCVHRSYLVNMSHINCFDKNDILLSNGTRINMGTKASAVKQVKQRYFKYIEEDWHDC